MNLHLHFSVFHLPPTGSSWWSLTFYENSHHPKARISPDQIVEQKNLEFCLQFFKISIILFASSSIMNYMIFLPLFPQILFFLVAFIFFLSYIINIQENVIQFCIPFIYLIYLNCVFIILFFMGSYYLTQHCSKNITQ